MRLILSLILLIPHIGFSQSDTIELKFDTKYYDAVDKWVAFPKKDTDTTHNFGFIYIDQQAGFTFDYNSNFEKTNDGLKKLPRKFKDPLKLRLTKNTINIAVLTEEQIAELELPKEPEWLVNYKKDSITPRYLKNIGLHYNANGASNLALEPLLKAYDIDPHFDGLEFELSFAYNALGQFERAISILEKAIENDSKNFYFYRELGFSYKNLNKIEEAEKIYRKGIKMSDNNFEKSEMAVNMAQSYFELRNKEKFDEWAKLTRKYAEKDSRYSQFIEHFEQNWNKK